jgi:hypothetical protein
MRYLLAIILLLFTCKPVSARMLYGYFLPEDKIKAAALVKIRQDHKQHPMMLATTSYVDAREKPRKPVDRSSDFLIMVSLIGFVGVFRVANPSYFRNLYRAFRNPTLSTRQLKEQLRQDSPVSLIMDIIFCISLGTYVFFAVTYFHRNDFMTGYPPGLIMTGCIGLFMLVYIIRFLFLKFTGWVFNIPEITDTYAFNVFLINKILGIALLPFSVILAFGQGSWVQASLFLSILVIAVLLLNRYIRSGVVFGYFLKFSKFHFFMYLCASELLPLAVLVKLINQWLIA